MNDIAAQEHAFHFNEAAKAFEEMCLIAFDMSHKGWEMFQEAQDRFNLHRARCQKEFQLFQEGIE